MPNQKVSISSLKLVSSIVPEIPDIANIEAGYAREKALATPMGAETNPWLENAKAISMVLDVVYIKSLQDIGAKIASATNCSGFGLTATDGETSYYTERTWIPVPSGDSPVPVYKSTRTGVSNQGSLTTTGRLGGLGGWTLDKDAIVAALASYAHNFVTMLMAFFSRASLPLTKSVTLPNLVLEETREPKQFVPPLSMSFSKLPFPMFTNTIRVSTPVKSSFWVELWGADKSVLGKTEVLEVEPGTSDIVINNFLLPWETNGFVNIEPNDAPQGLVIESIGIFPPI